MAHPDQIRKPIPRGPRGERGSINIPQIDGPFIQWQSPDGTWDDPDLRVNTLGPEGPSGDAQYFSTRSQAIAHNITTGLPAIKTYGYHTPGDGGGATYKLVTSGEDFTSLDGQKWALAEPIITSKMTGAYGNGTTPDQAAFAAAFALTDEIVVPAGNYFISANTTWAKGKKINFLQGAIITVDSGVTLVINGRVTGGDVQIFTGAGTVVGIRDVRPTWFGTNGFINGTSATSLAVGTGSKTLTYAGGRILLGRRIIVYSAATPTKFMEGLATTAAPLGGGSVTILVDTIGGSGSATDWIVEASEGPALKRMIACVESDLCFDSDGDRTRIHWGRVKHCIRETIAVTPTVYCCMEAKGGGIGLGGTVFYALPQFAGATAFQIAGSVDPTRQLASYDIGAFQIANSVGGTCVRGITVGAVDDGGGGFDGALRSLFGINKIEEIEVVGFQQGWLIISATGFSVHRCSADIQGISNSTAISFAVSDGFATGDCDIYGFRYSATIGTTSKGFGFYNGFAPVGATSLAGVHIHGGQYYRADVHIDVESQHGYIGDVTFDGGSQFDGPGGKICNVVASGADSLISKINWRDGWYNAMTNGGWSFTLSGGGKIEQCKIRGNEINFVGGQILFVGAGAAGIFFDDNEIKEANAGVGVAIARFGSANEGCSFDGNKAISTSLSPGTSAYFVQWDVGSVNFTCIGNNGGVLPGLTLVVNDNSGVVTKVVEHNT